MTEMLNQDSRPEQAQCPTREAWLHQAIEAFRSRFTEVGLPLPARLHVSVDWLQLPRGKQIHPGPVLGPPRQRRRR